MKNESFEKEIAELIKGTPEEIKKNVPLISNREKLKAIIRALNQRPELETIGNSLNTQQFITLVESVLELNDKNHWKLSPLLVGMSHETFYDAFSKLKEKDLAVFKVESVTEPVQHHLTMISHKMNGEIEHIVKELSAFEKSIVDSDPQKLLMNDVQALIEQIEHFSQKLLNLIDISKKALSIAWNTHRVDLIETFNRIKDSCQKLTLLGIGKPSTLSEPRTGLYDKLYQHLFQIYGDPLNNTDPETLLDTEPAMEALVKFSIWYLKDYWEIGLLPTVKHLEDLDVEHSSEQERIQFRENLFNQAKENLSKIGLNTVLDLKTHFIFSKGTLQEFIREKL